MNGIAFLCLSFSVDSNYCNGTLRVAFKVESYLLLNLKHLFAWKTEVEFILIKIILYAPVIVSIIKITIVWYKGEMP